jgi:hypothetical protein
MADLDLDALEELMKVIFHITNLISKRKKLKSKEDSLNSLRKMKIRQSHLLKSREKASVAAQGNRARARMRKSSKSTISMESVLDLRMENITESIGKDLRIQISHVAPEGVVRTAEGNIRKQRKRSHLRTLWKSKRSSWKSKSKKPVSLINIRLILLKKGKLRKPKEMIAQFS